MIKHMKAFFKDINVVTTITSTVIIGLLGKYMSKESEHLKSSIVAVHSYMHNAVKK